MRIALFVIIPLVGLILGWTIRWLYARFQLSSSEQKAERVVQEALKEAARLYIILAKLIPSIYI